MTVCPGTQLPQVVVDTLVICFDASVNAGAYVLVVVGEGIEIAYRTVSLNVYEKGWK